MNKLTRCCAYQPQFTKTWLSLSFRLKADTNSKRSLKKRVEACRLSMKQPLLRIQLLLRLRRVKTVKNSLYDASISQTGTKNIFNSMVGSVDRFDVSTRFCYGAISASVLSILENVTQTSMAMEIITVDITPAA